MAPEANSVKTVAVLPQATVAIAGHCQAHANDSVYGILLGSSLKQGAMVVTDAIAVSHGAPPSLPIAEAALGLADQHTKAGSIAIVGWYTAPMLLEDTRPGPVALRLAAQLASSSVEPVLLVVQNKALSACVLDGASAKEMVQALGRDFGDQWLEKIATTVEKPEAVGKAIQQTREMEKEFGTDLLDHLKDVSKVWYPNKERSEFVKKIEQS